MFYTPRFSYRVLKTVICACSRGTATAASAVYGELQDGYWDQGSTRVGYTGWYQGGVYRYTQPRCSRSKQGQRSGPVGPAGAGVVVPVQRTSGSQVPPTPLRSGARSAVPGILLEQALPTAV